MNYDFGARHYDPRIGRWTGVDLLAETYENVSPYNYVANSPINNIDANGMDFSQGIPCPKWGEPGGGLFSAGANVLASFAAGLLGSVGNGPVALDKANAPGQQASLQSRSNITSSLNEDGTTVQEGGGDPGGKKEANANQGRGDPQRSGFNIPDAIATLNARAQDCSSGKCATFVRIALQAGGINTSDRPASTVSAKNYGPYLLKKGFNLVNPNGYTPVAGDVAVFDGFSGHPNGHIEMYNGNQWISDFKQNYFTPGPAYRKPPDPYQIFRW